MSEIVNKSLDLLERPSGQLVAAYILLLTVAGLLSLHIDLGNGAARDVLVALLVMLRPGSRRKDGTVND